MRTYEVTITPYAFNQMAEIRDYVAYDLLNPNAAKNLIQQIRTEVMGLNQMPERFRPVDEEPWGNRGVRKLLIKNFFAYYWIDEAAGVVHVTAFTYAMRNQKNVLTEMDEGGYNDHIKAEMSDKEDVLSD
ncbi:MAG: type II toxin-antitoxin system RelE/ParE family toxin [Oscillospiraceae bacterium]|nr:type II toxin-antitoxin system RelE/ParE family toxin [Oscillospiraceae bacterium]